MATAQPSPASSGVVGAVPGPMRRILCTIDFSEASAPAVAEAVALARAGGGEITVLFVVPCAVPSRAEPALPEGVTSAVAEDVAALLAPARAAGAAVRVCLRAGWPAHEILEVARRTAPDVIVMGTHGRGGFKRRVLGSVASEILANAMCPVLTVRRPPAAPVEKADVVVCGVGLSASSPRTVAHALHLARARGARLVLLHVVEGGADVALARRRLCELAAVDARPGDRVEEVVVAGLPARRILAMAVARRADLVVVGGEAYASLRDGSTTDRVIRGAPCAVLTVPSPRPAP